VDENLTEKEQIEELAKWWDENKTFVITGLALGASILFGWNYYKNQKLTRAYNASTVHSSLVEAVNAGNADAVSAAAQQLAADYSATPYSSLAPLSVAKLHVDNGDLDAAATALGDALNGPQEIAAVARLRLARIRIAQDRGSDAVALLANAPGQYKALFDEVRGDAYAAMGQATEAKDAYAAALDSEAGAVDRNFVQMKLDALGLGVETP
jgi:predicted negative regulator of RcsB-dependent stress response